MRLIDADKLEDYTDDKYSLGEIGRYERDCITNALKYAPTIDAEPVKHGHWIKEKYEKPICSVCGNEGFLVIVDSITADFPYCTWCGAKMDEEENKMSAELKPCPFCGGEAEQGYKPNHSYIVYCPNCGIGTGYKNTEEQAIEAWNRRVNDDE